MIAIVGGRGVVRTEIARYQAPVVLLVECPGSERLGSGTFRDISCAIWWFLQAAFADPWAGGWMGKIKLMLCRYKICMIKLLYIVEEPCPWFGQDT